MGSEMCIRDSLGANRYMAQSGQYDSNIIAGIHLEGTLRAETTHVVQAINMNINIIKSSEDIKSK